MNFFKRSLVSITRRKSKSIILFVAILLVCNVIAGAISVKKALIKTEDNIKRSIPIELKPEIDYENIGVNAPDSISEDTITRISKSSYLKDFYYSFKYSLTSDSLKSVESGMVIYRTLEADVSASVSSDSKLAGDNYDSYFSIIGTNTSNIKEVNNGTFSIIDGNLYTDEDVKNGNNVILISKELAKENNLKVGDSITLRRKVETYTETETKTLGIITKEYNIVGVFEAKLNKITDNDGKVIDESNPLANSIYMPNNTVKTVHDEVISMLDKYNASEYDEFNISASFYLNSIDDIENFNNDNLKLLPNGYKFTDNSNLFTSTLAPISSMEDISNFIMYAALIASIIIIGLISLLFFRERRHEMGIYLALGEYKINIAMQILIETLIVSLLAVFISIFTGNMVAKNISNNMLEDQIENKIDNDEYYYDEFGYQLNYSKDELLDKYNVQLDVTTIILIFLISIGSITVSTLIPIYYTLKINPKKILM